MWSLESFMGKTFVAKAIYGLIAVMAVLQVIDEHPPVPWRGAATLFGTTLGVTLLDAYIETITLMLCPLGNVVPRVPNCPRSGTPSCPCL